MLLLLLPAATPRNIQRRVAAMLRRKMVVRAKVRRRGEKECVRWRVGVGGGGGGGGERGVVVEEVEDAAGWVEGEEVG